MKRILAIILALLMLVTVFAACGNKNDTPTDNTKPSDNTDKPADNPSQGDDKPSDDKPSDSEIVVRDFGGESYTILTNSYTDYEFNGTFSGTVVQSAVMERQYAVERDFNVDVEVISKKGGWGERKDFTGAVRAEKASGGTDGIDLVATHSVYLGWMGVEGLGLDMAKYSDYIDFSKPWWNQNLYEALNLKGHVFMMIGDIAYTLYEYINVMFVNESQFESYFVAEGGTDYLYDLVDAGEWTWEKLWDFASAFGTGAAGDGKYGIITNTHAWRATFVSQEASLFQIDPVTGKMTVPNALGKKESEIIREMIEKYAQDNLDYVIDFNGIHPQYNDVFLAGNALFYPQTLDQAIKLYSSATEDYGIVPLPKYDTMQEQYKTQCRDTVTGNMLMSTSKNPEKAAIVTEGMAYYGHELITPAYYENSLQNRYLDQYVEILDMIREGLTYQPGDCYVQNSAGDGGTMRWDKFHQIVGGDGRQADTVYAASVATGRNELQSFYNKLAKLGIVYD